MRFDPRFQIAPRILRQLTAIEQTTGFLNAVELRPEWIAQVRDRIPDGRHPSPGRDSRVGASP